MPRVLPILVATSAIALRALVHHNPGGPAFNVMLARGGILRNRVLFAKFRRGPARQRAPRF